MSARSLFILAASIGLASAGLFEAHAIRRQDEALCTLQKRSVDASRQEAMLRQEGEALRQELAAAEELAARPASTAIDPITAVRKQETSAWLARVKQLKQLFDERPDQRIPEMQWLKDEDWLRVAKRASFEDDHATRKALGELRTSAKTRFFAQASPALRAFAGTAGGEPPSSITALVPHLAESIDPTVLLRYEIVKDDPAGVSIGQGKLTIREKAAIDPDYDSRPYASSNGQNSVGGSMNPPFAWIPDFQARAQQAYRAYLAANNGARPAGTVEVLPFIIPPLEPAKIELARRFEREAERQDMATPAEKREAREPRGLP